MKPRSHHAQDRQYFQRKETSVRYRRASFKNLSLGASRKVYLLGDGALEKGRRVHPQTNIRLIVRHNFLIYFIR